MKITTHTVGRFREVCFYDVEDEEARACSGLLNEDEAHDFAERLREVAHQLSAAATDDRSQTLLPFVIDRAA